MRFLNSCVTFKVFIDLSAFLKKFVIYPLLIKSSLLLVNSKLVSNILLKVSYSSLISLKSCSFYLGIKLFKENSEFINKTKDVILEHGITEWLNHPYTDTMMLKKKFDFSCLNFAAGYYNYHTKNEYVIIEDVFNALTLGLKVTNILGENKYKYKSKPTNHFNLF